MSLHLEKALLFLLLSVHFLSQENVAAYLVPSQPSSAFTGRSIQMLSSHQTKSSQSRGNLVMYDSSSDPPNKKSSTEENGSAWTVLANTEKWISDTLNGVGGGNAGANSSPYARKEVSFVCEHSDNMELLTANIFRRLREVRELGEHHAEVEKERQSSLGDQFKPRTFRQTFVVVIPFCIDVVDSFHVFDNLINSVNQARRNARDYVTEISIEKLDEDNYMDSDWTTSINMAQMHPNYGELTPEQRLVEEMGADKKGEVDLNYLEMKERRMKARRSPYPTVVVEIRATPPLDYPFGREEISRSSSVAPGTGTDAQESGEVTRADLNKLEALFSQSATFDHPQDESDKESGSSEDDFFNNVAKTGIKEVTFSNPMDLAHSWISTNDQFFQPESSTFVHTSTKHVDEGYEFLFSCISMHLNLDEENDEKKDKNREVEGTRNYLVMSNFLSSSATSFEKFYSQVSEIIQVIPTLKDKLTLSTFHPEHIEKEKRSPQPIFVLQWQDGFE